MKCDCGHSFEPVIQYQHRLICGDCTDAAVVARLLQGEVPALMVTDPPYGVSYDPEWRLEAGVNKPWQTRAEGRVENDDRADWRQAWALFDGDVAYVWHGALHAKTVVESLEACDFEIRSQLIWAKTSLVMGRGHYHWQHEPCWYAVRKGKTANWYGDHKQATVWEIANMHATQGDVDDGKTVHSTQKPVACMARPIQNHTQHGAIVYDPFAGSGTTGIACHNLGRRARMVEISEAYTAVILERFAGIGVMPELVQDAVLEGA